MVGALAADFPPDDVAGLDGLVHGDDLPVGVVGQVRADVGDAPVVDVGVGGLAALLAVVEDFLQSRPAQRSARITTSVQTPVVGDVAHREVDADVVGDVADVVGEPAAQLAMRWGQKSQSTSAVGVTCGWRARRAAVEGFGA